LGRIQKLEHQRQAYRLNLQKTQDRIHRLTAEIRQAMQEMSNRDPSQSQAERIYLDIVKNLGRHPNGRRYSIDTLTWAQEIQAASPAVLDTPRRVLPLTGESLLNSWFARNRRFVPAVLQDDRRIGEVIELWEQAVPHDIPDRTTVLAADAVAFRPLVTVIDDGQVRGLKHMRHLDDQNILTHFLKGRNAFTEFLHKRWDEPYSSMFIFRIQPIHPLLPCIVIHVYTVEHGKGTPDTVATLLKLKTSLETQSRFRIVGLAFDGDSYFNGLHDEFAA
jgi:hypothetical protein